MHYSNRPSKLFHIDNVEFTKYVLKTIYVPAVPCMVIILSFLSLFSYLSIEMCRQFVQWCRYLHWGTGPIIIIIMSELLDKQVNAQKEKISGVHASSRKPTKSV